MQRVASAGVREAESHASTQLLRQEPHARTLGVHLNTAVFAPRESWQEYAHGGLQTVERLATELGLAGHLHLWPDKSLGAASVARRMPQPEEYQRWLHRCWSRVSEWPA